MQDWRFYVVIILGNILGAGLYALKSRQLEFKDSSRRKMLLLYAICSFAAMFLVATPYLAWQLTGFHPADARAAERVIVQRYLDNGAQSADVHFIVKDRSTLLGYATVTFPDGSSVTTSCHADKGESEEFVATCS